MPVEAVVDTAKRSVALWASTDAKPYENGTSFGRRDLRPVLLVGVVCLGAYLIHDVLKLPVPLPSEEVVAFSSFVGGLYVARRFRR